MQLLYEIFPVFLFFMAFKFYGIYFATIVGIVATVIQVILTRLIAGNWEKKQVVTMCVFVLFGGMTLYFHNPIFVKWKPTIVFWIFAIVIILSQIFTPKPLMRRMMESALQDQIIPSTVWKKLNVMWALFFMLMGSVNLYVAYNYTNDAWVNFKFYGITGALIVASIAQAVYLFRYLTEDKLQ
jgi:intracellular septation protein